MPEESFKELINKNLYQVFLFTCPANIPLSFAVHPWFICSRKGEISRWEILHRKNQCASSWGYLHLNYLPPTSGIEVFTFAKKYYWGGKLISWSEGGENSPAHKMINFLEESPQNYPFCDRYSIFAPNSNTYAEWVIRHFPESNFKLPKNSFGRYYARKIA
ncbi:MAG: DUF3750 domain-containing protein [Patescibacteria group bacterium]